MTYDKSVRVKEVAMNGSGCGRSLKAEMQVTGRDSDCWAFSELLEKSTTRLPSICLNDNVEWQTVPRGSR